MSTSDSAAGRGGLGLILVVDSQRNMRVGVAELLREAGYHTLEAASGEVAWRLLCADTVDLVLTSTQTQPIDGFELLSRVKQQSPSTDVMVMTSNWEYCVQALQHGAAESIQKPFAEQELLCKVARVMEHSRLLRQRAAMTRQSRQRHRIDQIVGASAAMRELLQRAPEIAASDVHVLLVGERGTGKEFFARTLHAHSKRAEAPFGVVKCTGVSDARFDASLFGRRKLATDSGDSHRGLFEEARGGSLFLADIDEAPHSSLDRLRALLETGKYCRVGDERSWRADTRVFAATDQHVPNALRRCNNTVIIELPALRDRREHIPGWIDRFVNRVMEQSGIAVRIADEVLDELVSRAYPGNLDELQATIEQSARIARNGVIDSNALRAATPR